MDVFELFGEFVPIVCCTGPMSRLLFFSFLALSSIFVLLLFLDSERSPEDLYIPGYIHRVEKLLKQLRRESQRVRKRPILRMRINIHWLVSRIFELLKHQIII